MGRQFSKVDGTYGAPMGRREYREPPTRARSVRVFRVRLDAGGYDDGGAYWGLGLGPLYCATDGAEYRMFCRAECRLEAIAEFRIAAYLLKAGCPEYGRLKQREEKGILSASGVILRQKLDALGFGGRA